MDRHSLRLPFGAALGALALFSGGCTGVKNAYAPGENGVCEIKLLPAARVIETREAGDPAEEATMNKTFRPLFFYIRDNAIPMTAPVEMRGEGGAVMAFHLDPDSAARTDLPAREGVTGRTLPERHVAALAARGSYTPERLRETERALRAWLAENKAWAPAGPAYAVYWDPPFMPGFLKKSEVHIPVEPAGGPSAPSASAPAK